MDKKDITIGDQVKKWEEIGTPYCLYCFKEFIGKKKWKHHKFCNQDHRDLYKMVKSRAIKGHIENTSVARFCEDKGCENLLNEYQFKYCSPLCRTKALTTNKLSDKICAWQGCEKLIPKNNEKYCSTDCRDNYRIWLQKEARDQHWIKIQCRNCGKDHERSRSQLDKFKNKFCNQLCYIEWQHSSDESAGSRFMWDGKNNPVKSSRGLVEHYKPSVRKYALGLKKNKDVVKWEFPTKAIIIDGGFQYLPDVMVEYKDGHKEVVEIAERGESIQDRSSYRWQLLEFTIKQKDPSVSICRVVYTDELK